MNKQDLDKLYDALYDLDDAKWTLRKQIDNVDELLAKIEWPEGFQYIPNRGLRIKGEHYDAYYEVTQDGIVNEDGDWIDNRSFFEHLMELCPTNEEAEIIGEFLNEFN